MSRSLMKCSSPGCPLGATGEDGRHCVAHQGNRSTVADLRAATGGYDDFKAHMLKPPPPLLEQDSLKRKAIPMARGLLDYFPAALAEVAHISFIGNEKHNPGEQLHWSRGKSDDHADCILRHLAERGGGEFVDINGQQYYHRHSAALAWRALALLQLELEAEGKVAEAKTPRSA